MIGRQMLAAAMVAGAGLLASALPGGIGAGMAGSAIKAPGGARAQREQKTRRPNPGDVARYLRNTGWTDARYRRAAAKRRNQARNRRAHK